MWKAAAVAFRGTVPVTLPGLVTKSGLYLLIKMLLKTQPSSSGLGTALAHQGGTDEPTAQFSPPSATEGRRRAPELHACVLSSGDCCTSDEPRLQWHPKESGVTGQARC